MNETAPISDSLSNCLCIWHLGVYKRYQIDSLEAEIIRKGVESYSGEDNSQQ